MTPKTVAIGAALALVLVSAGAGAQETMSSWADGNDMKNFCHSEAPNFSQGLCVGFAMAVAEIAGSQPIFDRQRACIPPGVKRGQLKDIMVKFLDDHPEQLHLTATSLAARAYEEAFPCPK